MKVEIKERALKGGNSGLYLEYYERGFRKRENLHLYLIPDNAPDAKSINKKTYLKAMAVRSDRILNPPDFDKKPEDGIDSTTTWLEWVMNISGIPLLAATASPRCTIRTMSASVSTSILTV